jgi:glycosyltransferase involved in cell wall biosynthesis
VRGALPRSSSPDALPGTHSRVTRVLHLFPVSEIGGAERVLLNLMRFRQRPDIEHRAVVAAADSGPLGVALTRLGVPWQQVPRGRMRWPGALWRLCRQLRRIVRESAADVVLTNSPQGFLYARWSTFGLRVPVVLYYMTVPRRQLWQNGPLDILAAKWRPAATFTASRAIERIVTGWGLANVQTVYHGVAVEPPDASAISDLEEHLSRLGIGPCDPVVLLPGRLQPWKGQHVLVAAFPEVLKVFPSAHAVLIGGSLFGQDLAYANCLEREIAALSLTDRVHVLGHQPPAAWFDRAAVVIHASTRPDPFPLVCIEALAARRPLITNRLSGTCEILEDGREAVIVEPGDAATLARGIVRVLGDPEEARRMAAAGYQRYLATSTPGPMVQKIETTLVELSVRARVVVCPG